MDPARKGPAARVALVAAVTAAAALLGLTTAGAFVAKHGRAHQRIHARRAGRSSAGRGRRCHFSIRAEPRVVAIGEATSVFGALKCRGSNGVAGQPVTLYARSAGSGGFSVAGTTSTEANGSYQLTPRTFATNTVFYVRSGSAHSGERTVRVAVEVTPVSQPADGAQLFTGAGPFRNAGHARLAHQVTFSGKVNPLEAGARVALQRENATADEEWRRIALGVVDEHGEYTIRHTFGAPGAVNIRVVVRPRSRLNAPGATTPVSYEISQAQNPLLTIKSSANPISYGGSTTITGIASGAAHQPVTLLARIRGGQFAPVAKATTNGSGEYAFTQSPPHGTAYRVTSGASKSAVLFEGVKYALGPPATSASEVQAGQPFTVTGAVAPAHAGHVVYLERQFPSKIGYHVVAVGTVTAAGTYSISHVFFGVTAGAVLRVKIPGDPEEESVASAPFTLAVTPAPASSLKPVAPGRLPSEGQI